MAPFINRLVSHWRRQGLVQLIGNSEAQLLTLEQREGLNLPSDFREYFLTVNGMPEIVGQSQDAAGFAFWPLGRMVNAQEELESSSPNTQGPDNCRDYYVFADYLDWSWAYAIRLKGNPESIGAVVLIGAETVPEVASSFSDFVDAYLRDDPRLYPSRS